MSEEQVKGFIDQATQSIQGGMFNQAIELADQALALQPDNADALVLRGVALSQVNQPQAATEAFQKAVLHQPTNSKAFFNLAVHYSRLGQKDLALDAAREAVRLDPGHAGARDLVTQMERELGVASQTASEGTTPPVQVGQPTGNPYANQNPYQQPNAPYMREGYGPSVHSVAFVEKMGPNWVTLGWVLAALSLIMLVVGFAVGFGDMQQAFSNPTAARDPFAGFSGGRLFVSLADMAIRAGALAWVIIDIIDRRGNWLWLVLFVICCCCAPIQAIYMLAGRKPTN